MMIIDEMLKRLRYVKRYPDPESEIRHDDINAKIDTLKAIRDVLKEKIGEDPLVDELDAILSLIPYVKAGDIVEPEYHNLVVDALKKVRELLAKIEQKYAEIVWRRIITGPIWGVDGGVDDRMMVFSTGTVWQVMKSQLFPRIIPPTLWGIHAGCEGITTGENILYFKINLRDVRYLGDEVSYL